MSRQSEAERARLRQEIYAHMISEERTVPQVSPNRRLTTGSLVDMPLPVFTGRLSPPIDHARKREISHRSELGRFGIGESLNAGYLPDQGHALPFSGGGVWQNIRQDNGRAGNPGPLKFCNDPKPHRERDDARAAIYAPTFGRPAPGLRGDLNPQGEGKILTEGTAPYHECNHNHVAKAKPSSNV